MLQTDMIQNFFLSKKDELRTLMFVCFFQDSFRAFEKISKIIYFLMLNLQLYFTQMELYIIVIYLLYIFTVL